MLGLAQIFQIKWHLVKLHFPQLPVVCKCWHLLHATLWKPNSSYSQALFMPHWPPVSKVVITHLAHLATNLRKSWPCSIQPTNATSTGSDKFSAGIRLM